MIRYFVKFLAQAVLVQVCLSTFIDNFVILVKVLNILDVLCLQGSIKVLSLHKHPKLFLLTENWSGLHISANNFCFSVFINS